MNKYNVTMIVYFTLSVIVTLSTGLYKITTAIDILFLIGLVCWAEYDETQKRGLK